MDRIVNSVDRLAGVMEDINKELEVHITLGCVVVIGCGVTIVVIAVPENKSPSGYHTLCTRGVERLQPKTRHLL